MPRSRTARSPATIEGSAPAIDHDELEQAGHALAARAQQIGAVEAQFGLDLPYNLDLWIVRIRQHATESALRLVEIGRMLIVMRERESREVFDASLARAGMAPRFARRCMQAALKLHDKPMLQQLGVSKALELMSEDDDTLDALEAGGTLAGLTLDELDTMTVRELKETLRAERAERAEEKSVDEQIIRKKDERINKLTRERHKSASERQVRAQADELLRDIDDAAVEAASQISRITSLHSDLNQLYAEAGLEVDADVAERIEANARWASEQANALAEVLGD